LSGAYLLLKTPGRTMAKFLHADAYRPFAGFYVYRGHRYENNDIFLKLPVCRPTLLLRCAHAMGWSVWQ